MGSDLRVPQTEHVQAILNLGSTAKRVELEFGTHQHQTDSEAVGLAKELIDAESGRLEPEKIRASMPKRGVSCYRPRSSSERPQIEVAPEGKALRRKSSTSWRHLKRILRRRDGQSAGCGAETNG